MSTQYTANDPWTWASDDVGYRIEPASSRHSERIHNVDALIQRRVNR
jgi:hypothetical protein